MKPGGLRAGARRVEQSPRPFRWRARRTAFRKSRRSAPLAPSIRRGSHQRWSRRNRRRRDPVARRGDPLRSGLWRVLSSRRPASGSSGRIETEPSVSTAALAPCPTRQPTATDPRPVEAAPAMGAAACVSIATQTIRKASNLRRMISDVNHSMSMSGECSRRLSSQSP